MLNPHKVPFFSWFDFFFSELFNKTLGSLLVFILFGDGLDLYVEPQKTYFSQWTDQSLDTPGFNSRRTFQISGLSTGFHAIFVTGKSVENVRKT